MDDETKLKILNHWISNPEAIGKVPHNLKDITEEDISFLINEIEMKQPNMLQVSDIINHAEKIRRKIKDNLEIEFIQSNKEVILRQIKLQEEIKTLQENQADILTNTFWIYSIIAIVMFSQLIILVFESQFKPNLYTVSISVSLVILSLYLVIFSYHQIKLKSPIKQRFILIPVILIIVLIIFVALLGYYFNKFEIQTSNLVLQNITNINKDQQVQRENTEIYNQSISPLKNTS